MDISTKDMIRLVETWKRIDEGKAEGKDWEIFSKFFKYTTKDMIERLKEKIVWSHVISVQKNSYHMDTIGEAIFSLETSPNKFKYRENYLHTCYSSGWKLSAKVKNSIMIKNLERELRWLFKIEYNPSDNRDIVNTYLSICESFRNEPNFDVISEIPNLTHDLIRDHINEVNWTTISKYHFLDSYFIFLFHDYLDIEILKEREGVD